MGRLSDHCLEVSSYKTISNLLRNSFQVPLNQYEQLRNRRHGDEQNTYMVFSISGNIFGRFAKCDANFWAASEGGPSLVGNMVL